MRDWITSKNNADDTSVSAAANESPKIEQLQATIGQVIKGKQDTIKLAVVALIARGHLLIEDVPGIGKTTLPCIYLFSVYSLLPIYFRPM